MDLFSLEYNHEITRTLAEDMMRMSSSCVGNVRVPEMTAIKRKIKSATIATRMFLTK